MIKLKPHEVYQQILRHPKLVHSLLPHFTVIRKHFSSHFESDAEMVRSVLRKALANLQGRLYARVDYQTNELILGFEEGSDATFFELMSDDEMF